MNQTVFNTMVTDFGFDKQVVLDLILLEGDNIAGNVIVACDLLLKSPEGWTHKYAKPSVERAHHLDVGVSHLCLLCQEAPEQHLDIQT
jgi:hypothetical protein